jgi:hypothetical protein
MKLIQPDLSGNKVAILATDGLEQNERISWPKAVG